MTYLFEMGVREGGGMKKVSYSLHEWLFEFAYLLSAISISASSSSPFIPFSLDFRSVDSRSFKLYHESILNFPKHEIVYEHHSRSFTFQKAPLS